jgi:hypothetical protein
MEFKDAHEQARPTRRQTPSLRTIEQESAEEGSEFVKRVQRQHV